MMAGIPGRENTALGCRQPAEWGFDSLRHSEKVLGAEHTDSHCLHTSRDK